MREALICEPLRTPVGRFGGVFRELAVTELNASDGTLAALLQPGTACVTGIDSNGRRRRERITENLL